MKSKPTPSVYPTTLSSEFRDLVQMALDRLRSEEVQSNLHRLGTAGADDVQTAIAQLEMFVEQEHTKQVKEEKYAG